MDAHNIKVIELFAGVGGFRVGLEAASEAYNTIWNNQWEPSTIKQDASFVYRARFGSKGHSNVDINLVPTSQIPDHDLLVGGFPCQDYSVASTLSRSGGIEGKKGVLWWQIYRILKEKGEKRPNYIFFENVDRLLGSPAKQRGRDFAIILASLSDLGYTVEWRVINAADYGMPQRRRRTYIIGYMEDSIVEQKVDTLENWVLYDGVMAEAFPMNIKTDSVSEFKIEGEIPEVSEKFNQNGKISPFGDAGIMKNRQVYSVDSIPCYEGSYMTLGDNIVSEDFVPEEFFIPDEDTEKWKYEKAGKKIERISKEGFRYTFSEGAMAFPDFLDRPSRTIITGEGGASASRFKHVITTKSGRLRRLLPLELERLNMFPDNHTLHSEVSDSKRAFLMGNALVCGVVREIGKSLYRKIFGIEPVSHKPIESSRNAEPELNLSLFSEDDSFILPSKPKKQFKFDSTRHLLIGYVKSENIPYFIDGGLTKYYYTGKTRAFPSTISLNKLSFFSPYIKGKGIKDIYIITKARIGTKAEIVKTSQDREPRLILELEYFRSLPIYTPVKLNIFHTYTDTFIGKFLDSNSSNVDDK